MSSSDEEIDRLFRRFVQSTTDYAVIMMTPQAVITAWLGAADRLFGYGADETIGRHLSMIFTPEDVQRGLAAQEISLAIAAGRSEDDRWHVRKNQGRFWASGVLTAIHDEAGTLIGLCKTLRDKTDVRTQIESLENRIAGREAEIERRGAAISATVHELRNPLNPMVMAVELLRRADPTPVGAKALQVLQSQTELLSNLINDLSAATQVDPPDLLLNLQAVNLSDALRSTSHGFGSQLEHAGVALRLVQPTRDIWVRADPSRLQQMLLNLIGNSIKYTLDGGHIGLSASIEADMAVVRIEDDGIGISPAVLPLIFDMFTREGRAPQVDGMGVGLAVVKMLATLHGGGIEARSSGPGLGSVFALRLPLCEPVDLAPPAA